MEDGQVRIVWQGKVVKGRQEVLGRVDTTIPNILVALSDLGKHPNEFNDMIVSACPSKSGKLPFTYFVKGPEVGPVLASLREKGLCVEVG